MSDKLLKWELISLGDICEITTGKYDANHASLSGKYRFYTCAFEYMYCNTNRFKGECLILPGNGANVGEVFYYNGEFDAYQRTYVLTHIKISSKFLFYHLKFRWKSINADKQFGSATNYIRMGNFTDYLVPLPPLAEQHRIVAKIEELFSELDKGIETLKTAQQQLKVYRQAVLKYAFEGRLTNPDVKEGELPEGWEVKTISQITDNLTQGWSPKCENRASFNEEEWAVITTTAIQHIKFSDKENKVLPKDLQPRTQHELVDGDVLITRAGPRTRVGVCCLVISPRKKLLNCDKAYRIKVRRELILPSYLVQVLNTAEFLTLIDKCKSGGNDSGLNLTQTVFLSIKIPLPIALSEQEKIIEEIESRLSVCDKIEESIEQGLQQAEALRQSILKKAFEGKLVPQDPKDLPANPQNKFFVYVLECSDGSWYKGFTTNIIERWKEHVSGRGSEHTKKYPPLKLIHWEEFSTQSEAIKREKYFKSGEGRNWLKQNEKLGRLRQAGEPASVLLERIKAERANAQPEKKTKAKK